VLPESFAGELRQNLATLEQWAGKRFGDAEAPLLLSLRASPPTPVPYLIKTVLNLGINEGAVRALAQSSGEVRFAWDAYVRFLRSFGVQVLRVPADLLDEAMEDIYARAHAEEDTQLDAAAMEDLAHAYQSAIQRATGKPTPEEPVEQLRMAVEAGFGSWATFEAEEYRIARGWDHVSGTALVVQPMVFGTAPGLSGAGRFFTRHPATGERTLYGRFLFSAQGPDLTAGVRLAEPLEALFKQAPEMRNQLLEWQARLEAHFHDALEVHFAVEDGRLHLLQCLNANRTGRAGMRIALEMVQEGLATERQALLHLDPLILNEYLHPILDPSAKKDLLTRGLPASPGSAVGRAVFFAEQAEELAGQGVKTILVRHETTPEDIGGLNVAQGILTATGGLTSHAAVVARGMGKCCVVGAGEIEINYLLQEMTVGGRTVKRLDWVSLDGNTGEIFLGQLPQVQPTLEGGVARVLEWADQCRKLRVRANADTPEDARHAVELGAEGIGLCRTEHMFFHIDRIPVFRKMILAGEVVGRSAALAELLPLQRRDFMELFRVMNGRPVTIRLLDPPLHEFLPRGIRSQTRIAKAMGIPVEAVQRRAEVLHETNPMLGHRGCRLAITYPEIYQMQVRAITEAACIVTKEGIQVHAEIMVPLISTTRELDLLREQIEALVKQVMEEMGEILPILIGTMIETPRAAVCAASIARFADFFSFGTNDLTQMSFGFSRDDAGMFLPTYVAKGILDKDPFVELDQAGVGGLIRLAVEQGRKANPKLKIGICGEHGGDPPSVHFTHALHFDYVSCSPYRIPIARLAAAQAAVMEDEGMI
jgi:pyruvate,orthophosphate dikinase